MLNQLYNYYNNFQAGCPFLVESIKGLLRFIKRGSTVLAT